MGVKDLKTRASLTITVDKAVKQYLEEYNKRTGVPVSRYIDRLVMAEMEREKGTS